MSHPLPSPPITSHKLQSASGRPNSLIEKKVFIFLALFATLLLFIISPDSYTHDLYGRCDSAWFFMCGKAWMEGLTPYVDFADNKGPLLWLIYGIGYLISPHNYIGVFWLSCLCYSIIFYTTYLTAQIFLAGRRPPLICAILMALAFFNPMFHYETRAEDWSLLFLTASMYLTCKILYTKDVNKNHTIAIFFILGVCFASLVLIKYNIAAMQTIFILFALYHTIRSNHAILIPLLSLLTGMLVISVPFIIYFAYRGCIGAFMQEYFINSFSTSTSHTSLLNEIIYEWGKVFTDKFRLPLFLFLITGSVLLYYKLERYKLFPLISTLFVFSLSAIHAYWDYYFNCCAICYIWAFIYFLKQVSFSRFLKATTLGVIIALTVCQLIIDKYIKHNMFWNDGWERKHFYNIEYWVSQTDHPKIINAFYYEYGHGILSNSLPVAKYWSIQNGRTNNMIEEHIQYIIEQQPDFVFYDADGYHSLYRGVDENFMHSAGYRYCYEDYVYTKKRMQNPSAPIHVTNWEVLTKQMPKALRK